MAFTPSSLCTLCEGILKGALPESGQWLPHHTRANLLAASDRGCFICRTIVKSRDWDTFPGVVWDDFQYHVVYERKGLHLDLDWVAIRPTSITAVEWMFDKKSETDRKDLAEFITPPLDPSDSAFLAHPNRWIQECLHSHAKCQLGDASYRPTRLLKIIDTKRLRLVESSKWSTGPYVSFSHCWGKHKTLMLKIENLDQFSKELLIADLPKKYQEAISLSYRLGIGFIWIDSLCIVQNSSEDWQREAITMKQVYGSSLLNICSAAASDNMGVSFRGRDPSIMKPLLVTSTWDGEAKESFYLEFNVLWDDIVSSPLRERAWVFQEWYLSPRSLILANSQLWWHCRHKVACERHPDGYPERGALSSMKNDKIKAKHDVAGASVWHRCLKRYLETHLTHESDRLIAFAGVAQAFGQYYNISNEYLAGLWRSHLPQALCWGVGNCRATRTPKYTAPSWTWASMKCPMDLAFRPPSLIKDEGTSVEAVWLKYADKDHITGIVQGGYIRLRGRLIGPLNLDHGDGTKLPRVDDGCGIGGADCSLHPDETVDETGNMVGLLLSCLDNLTSGLCEQGLVDGATRKTERLTDAKGRFFCLPIASGRTGMLYLLALYQPADQHTVFHRIGTIDFRKGIASGRFGTEYPITTVIVL